VVTEDEFALARVGAGQSRPSASLETGVETGKSAEAELLRLAP
jgi:hypothetical protein